MIHVLFDSSAAGTLRQLLFHRGVRQRVVDLTETLDWGPISTGIFEAREAWLDRHSPNDFGGWGWIAEHVVEFRKKVAATAERLIWIAPRSATEQAGLYWYLSQFGGVGARMIVADYPLRGAWRGEPPLRLGELQQEAIAELLDEGPRVEPDTVRFPGDRWQHLMAEDALVRVVEDDVLKSAPHDYFDRFLLSHCSNMWSSWGRVVADAAVDAWDFGHSPCDTLLHWRLRELVAREVIACDSALPVDVAVSRQVRVRRVALQ